MNLYGLVLWMYLYGLHLQLLWLLLLRDNVFISTEHRQVCNIIMQIVH